MPILKERAINYKKPVEVYRNLHRNMWSIRQAGRVVGYAHTLQLLNASFVVRPGGRAKVLATKRKNVHAFAKGLLINGRGNCSRQMFAAVDLVDVTYNPYIGPTFINKETSAPVLTADVVSFYPRRVSAYKPKGYVTREPILQG